MCVARAGQKRSFAFIQDQSSGCKEQTTFATFFFRPCASVSPGLRYDACKLPFFLSFFLFFAWRRGRQRHHRPFSQNFKIASSLQAAFEFKFVILQSVVFCISFWYRILIINNITLPLMPLRKAKGARMCIKLLFYPLPVRVPRRETEAGHCAVKVRV